MVVLFGGQSAEHEVSCISAVHVLNALDRNRYDVLPVGIRQDGIWVRSDSAMQLLGSPTESVSSSSSGSSSSSSDAAIVKTLTASGSVVDAAEVLAVGGEASNVVVLPILHGPLGEDGTVQGLLELAGVAYVGSGVLGSAMAMDKAVAKQMFDAVGIPQARWLFRRSWELDSVEQLNVFSGEVEITLGWPVFVKPANMGSSVGVSKAHDTSEFVAAVQIALQFDDTVVVDEAIVGREVEFAVLGNEHPEVSLPGEVFPAKEFYDFNDKYVDGNATFEIPADFSLDDTAAGQEIARRAYAALRCEGMSRVDFFFETGGRGWLVNEVNTIPGFTPISMYPKMWEASGVSYAELVDRLIELAQARHARRSVYAGRARLR